MRINVYMLLTQSCQGSRRLAGLFTALVGVLPIGIKKGFTLGINNDIICA